MINLRTLGRVEWKYRSRNSCAYLLVLESLRLPQPMTDSVGARSCKFPNATNDDIEQSHTRVIRHSVYIYIQYRIHLPFAEFYPSPLCRILSMATCAIHARSQYETSPGKRDVVRNDISHTRALAMPMPMPPRLGALWDHERTTHDVYAAKKKITQWL